MFLPGISAGGLPDALLMPLLGLGEAQACQLGGRWARCKAGSKLATGGARLEREKTPPGQQMVIIQLLPPFLHLQAGLGLWRAIVASCFPIHLSLNILVRLG